MGCALLRFWATVYKTVRLCYRTVVCPDLSCLPVCNVDALWPNGWMDQDETLHGRIGLGPGHIVFDRYTALPPPKRAQPPIFGPCLLRPNGPHLSYC